MALPFDLPVLAEGFASLTPAARATGRQVADAAARALSAVVGREVSVRGRPGPGVALPRSGASRLAVELTAVPAVAALEVDCSLTVALVDAVAGGPGAPPGATALTPVESAALELLALVAIDAACSVELVEAILGPRLARGLAEPGSALSIELDVSAGDIAGRARLLLPAAAVRAFRGPAAPDGPGAAIPILASVRGGRTVLSREELSQLAPGDVVLLDPPGGEADALVLPGGARISGRHEDGAFHVVEVTMTDRNGQLPLTLEVELARVELPLCEVARLEPGAVLPLALDRRGLVTLRIGERTVARGELVEVDGAVGVRVLAVEMGP